MHDVAFRKRLSSIMLDNKYDRFVKNRKTGKLDTKSFYKINTSSKLFKRREARQNKHYSVSLVVDTSGSMRGSKEVVTRESTKKLSEHLSKIGISHNVIAYSTYSYEVKPFSEKRITAEELKRIQSIGWVEDKLSSNLAAGGKITLWYNGNVLLEKTGKEAEQWIKATKKITQWFPDSTNYYEDLLSSFYSKTELAEMVNQSSFDFGLAQCLALGSTSIGEAIAFAREKLSLQQGKKIMIFLTDGRDESDYIDFESPNFKNKLINSFNPKQEVEKTLRQNIEYYGIGIQDDAINDYSPAKRTAVIRNIDQLYPHILYILSKNLKRG